MKFKKSFLFIFFTILLAGCGNNSVIFKSGKIEMDRLVTLEQIRDNPDNYLGKVITLKLGLSNLSCGSSRIDFKHGIWYSGDSYYFNPDCPVIVNFENKRQSQFETNHQINAKRDSIQWRKPDSNGSFNNIFEVLLNYHQKERIAEVPDWVSEKRKPCYYNDKFGSDEMCSFPGTRFITGILIAVQPGVRQTEVNRYEYKSLIIIPSGIKVIGNKKLWSKTFDEWWHDIWYSY